MVAIRAVRLAFAHGDAVPLFQDVSFHIGPGWWGLVGENGAGKTTLLRLIAGQLEPAAGSIAAEPDWCRVLLCEQAVDAAPELAGELAAASDGEAIRLRARLGLSPALADYPGALLLVSHDEAFAAPLVDRVWQLEGGELREVS